MKILRRSVLLFLWMLPGLFIGLFVQGVVISAHELLNSTAPDVFPIYNAISEKALYEAQHERLNLIALVISLFIIVLISLIYNNERDEFVISKTDGLFEIGDILGDYVRSFIVSDLAASVIVGLIFAIPIVFIPDSFFSGTGVFPSLLNLFFVSARGLGDVGYCVAFPVAIALLHLPSVPLAAMRWRARWLTGFANER